MRSLLYRGSKCSIYFNPFRYKSNQSRKLGQQLDWQNFQFFSHRERLDLIEDAKHGYPLQSHDLSRLYARLFNACPLSSAIHVLHPEPSCQQTRSLCQRSERQLLLWDNVHKHRRVAYRKYHFHVLPSNSGSKLGLTKKCRSVLGHNITINPDFDVWSFTGRNLHF